MNTPIVMIIVGIALLAYAGYKIWRAIQLSQKISASKSWPAVSAEVASKRVREQWTEESGKSYHPEITYKYTIMGQEYEKTVSLPGIFSKNRAEKALGAIGAAMEVRYNQENPAETISGQDKINISDILVIIFSLAVAAFILFQAVF